ncbi:aldehyde dehydrogenase family protein [Aquipuribacter sp. MA13-6]|uniref:aldehyde dehydrogenase family protein n=1 Tax=unclassified Aquipuribacter TaxID=2635084 RepID=UPI003EEBCF32
MSTPTTGRSKSVKKKTPEPAAPRLDVRKTYKLYVGGKFPRSESGRTYAVHSGDGTLLAQAAQASRKDARDAVVAARSAVPAWSGATAYNRGQVLYRVAEMLEGRAAQFVELIADAEGVSLEDAHQQVTAAVDRWVWYAGWTDKISQVAGNANPVAGPYFNLSVPEPTGVVAVLAPQGSSLLGLTSVVAPVIATGNTCVVVTSFDRPLPAVALGEVLATSDLPGGVVNLLTGSAAELGPWLASHRDVDAIDLTGAAALTEPTWGDLEAAASDTLTRVLRPEDLPDGAEPDWTPVPDPRRMLTFMETKTVWHPKGR